MTDQPQPQPQPKKIPLVEVFGPTIQGEGALIGQQTYFLRFGLCDYRCVMCDSMHAVDPRQVRQHAEWLTQQEIAERLQTGRLHSAPNSTKWVTFSGGNPAIHDLQDLVNTLQADGWKIAVETQGTLAPDWLSDCDIVTVSPKGPGMGEKFEPEVFDAFLDDVTTKLNIKVVVFDERDLEFARMLYERTNIVGNYDLPYYLSLGNCWPPGYKSHDPLPPHNPHTSANTELVERLVTNYKRLWEDIQDDQILSHMRFLPQLHVFFWGNERGR